MFSDQDWQDKNKDLNLAGEPVASPKAPIARSSNMLWLVFLFLSVLATTGIFLLAKPYIIRKPSAIPAPPAAETQPQQSDPVIGKLPLEQEQLIKDLLNGEDLGDLKAEDLIFGMFYEKPAANIIPGVKNYELPLNIKTDVSNYYEISRKFDLDLYLDDLNNYGFALAQNSFSKEANDFFSAYRYLTGKDIPIVVTSDFLLYYYQNTLKQIYKEIEKNAFYDNVWDFSLKMYTLALAKYRNRLDQAGNSGDPVAEGERLELAFFAVVLSLLKPTEEQINRRENFTDERKFTMIEAENLSFDLPVFLKDDVNHEAALVREAKIIQKSPVFLYERDYRQYAVPENYGGNAKLNNFYLAIGWLNSVFPLYYIDGNCPNCLLDENDWMVNFSGAFNIADSLHKNQELKNQWAIIYKFMSFFTGLRSDLTFLKYHSAIAGLFGPNYRLEEIFSPANSERRDQLLALQNILAGESFLAIEGGISRTEPDDRPHIGMRFLQELYWPDDYIFGELTGPEMEYAGSAINRNQNITYCSEEKSKIFYRCRGFGLDVANMLYGLGGTSDYFRENTNYEYYETRLRNMQAQKDRFDLYAWNNNIYWSIMDINRQLVAGLNDYTPSYAHNDQWRHTRLVNTALGSWATLRLPVDAWVNYHDTQKNSLGAYYECNSFNFIEPEYNLAQELIAKNNMLINMLTILRVVDKTNIASIQLKEFNKKLTDISGIIRKELSGTVLNIDDCRYITNLIGQFDIEKKGARSFEIEFMKNRTSVQRVDGVKILVLVNDFNGQKMLLMGPVFNYSEGLK